jgi:hypothetical protein
VEQQVGNWNLGSFKVLAGCQFAILGFTDVGDIDLASGGHDIKGGGTAAAMLVEGAVNDKLCLVNPTRHNSYIIRVVAPATVSAETAIFIYEISHSDCKQSD